MKIGIIGLNKVGLTFGLLCQEIGYNVIGSDVDQKLIYDLNSKFSHNLEPQIRKLLYENINFTFHIEINKIITDSDIIFIFTNPKDNIDGNIDTSELLSVINHFYDLSALNIDVHDKKLVVCGLTNLGDMMSVYERLKMFNVEVAYHPQFNSDGDVYYEFKHTNFILVGTNSKNIFNDIIVIYSKIQSNEVNAFMMSLSSAEIARMAINSYTTMKINFSNLIANLLGKSGLQDEINLVLTALKEFVKKQENTFNHNLGFGGPVIPKDNRLLSKYIDMTGLHNNIPKIMDEFNKEYLIQVKELYKKMNSDKTIPFIIDSVSYNQKSDSTEESQRLKLCIDLLEEGYYVNVIENDDISYNLNELSKHYDNRLKFYPKNTNPKGIKINL